MLQWLLIALAQVKAGNTSENLLNEICQIIHSSYHAKGNTKKNVAVIGLINNFNTSPICLKSNAISVLEFSKVTPHYPDTSLSRTLEFDITFNISISKLAQQYGSEL